MYSLPALLSTSVILFTSCKGGVGKSTVCANLAMALAKAGKRVLVIDCDFGIRCLDLIMGLEDRAIYDISDIIVNRVELSKAIVHDSRSERLSFIAAPYNIKSGISEQDFKDFMLGLVKTGEYDYIFIDTPGGTGYSLRLAASVADVAFIIAAPSQTAVRAAEKTAAYMREAGVTRQRLIINKVAGSSAEKEKQKIISLIDKTRVRLIGAIPYDSELISAGDGGILMDEMLSFNVTRAFENIAYRMTGYPRPLFYGIKRLKKIK